jgi:ribokinase
MSVCVLGSINLDNVCRVARIPVAGETIMARRLDRFAGGKGANQAVAAAAWGSRSLLIGAVGRDEAGVTLLAHLTDAGVDVSAVAQVAGAPTGQAQICVSDSGENMIVVIGGANRAVDPAMAAAARIAPCRVFLAQLEMPLETVEALFRRAGDQGGLRILNAAPALPEARSLFPLADLIVVNEGELAMFAGDAKPATAEAAVDLARRLIGRPNQGVIVTLGAAGALAVGAFGVIRAEGYPAAVVDTTGAGDCFCGVLAAALAEGGDLARALALANAAAAVSVELAGAAAPRDLRARAEARLSAATPPPEGTLPGADAHAPPVARPPPG